MPWWTPSLEMPWGAKGFRDVTKSDPIPEGVLGAAGRPCGAYRAVGESELRKKGLSKMSLDHALFKKGQHAIHTLFTIL